MSTPTSTSSQTTTPGRNLDDKTAITEELLKAHFTLANRPTLAINARKIKEKLDALMVGTLGELRGAANGTWAALASLAPAVEEGLQLVFLTALPLVPSSGSHAGTVPGGVPEFGSFIRIATHEGLASAKHISYRNDKIKTWLDFIETRHVLHFKAPPATGKTSIAQLLYNKYSKLHGRAAVAYHRFSTSEIAGLHEFRKFWGIHYNNTQLLLLDEAQKGYSDKSLQLWGVIKGLLANEPNYTAKIILLSSYDEEILDESLIAMPAEHCVFLHAAALPGLSFSDDELAEVKASFTEKCFALSPELWEYIVHITNYHAGIILNILTILEKRITNENRKDYRYIMTEIHSGEFQDTLKSISRGLPHSDGILRIFNNESFDFLVLDNVLFQGSVVQSQLEQAERNTMNLLVRNGVLWFNNNSYKFPSPFHERCYMTSRFSSKRPKNPPPSLKEFLKRSICKMDPSVLKNSLSHGKDGIIYERQFQMDFFRAATSVLPLGNYISPDVPPAVIASVAGRNEEVCQTRQSGIFEGGNEKGRIDEEHEGKDREKKKKKDEKNKSKRKRGSDIFEGKK